MISSLICERNAAKKLARICVLAEMELLNRSSLGSINGNIVGVMWHWEPSLAVRKGLFFLMCILGWSINVHE